MEYSSDSEKENDSENALFIDSESSHKYHMDFGSDGRRVMERLINPKLKSTEPVLSTPQKHTKLPKTLENSARKKLLRLNYTFLNTFLKIFLFLKKPEYLKC